MVTRQPIDVRRAGTGDIEDLLQLWALAREDIGLLGRAANLMSQRQVRERLQAALLGDEIHVVLARWDGRPAGYTLVRVVPVVALLEGLAVQIDHMYVVPDLRRHGVARALLAAVAGIAERVGAEQIISSAPPAARDSHRFLARLGFSPVAVRRVVSTAVLRRKLAGEGRRGGLEDLLSRRRSLRARAGWQRRGESATLLPDELAVVAGEPDGDGDLLGVADPPVAGSSSADGSADWPDGPQATRLPEPLPQGHEAVNGSGTSVTVGGAP